MWLEYRDTFHGFKSTRQRNWQDHWELKPFFVLCRRHTIEALFR